MSLAAGWRRRLLLLVLAALVAAALVRTTVRVPRGTIGVLPDGEVLPPGWHLRLSGSERALIAPGAYTLRGTVSLDTPEGARREVPYRLEVSLGLEAIERAAAEPQLGSPLAQWRQAASAAIREAAADSGLTLLRAGAGRRQALALLRGPREPFSGARATDLRLGVAASSDLRGRAPHAAVVLIGLDGADWLVLEPMLAAGKLPNLRQLIEQGARAHLRSELPLLSPLLWTSIVTGVTPDRHGIVDFTVYDPATRDRAPISSRARSAPALWNVLTSYGLHSAWIGWWATWPAEPTAGVMVSDHVSYSLFAIGQSAEAAGKVYPPEIWPELRSRVTAASQVPWEDLHRFARITRADLARLQKRAPPPPGEDFSDRLDHLRQVVASTRTYHDLARWARLKLRPDLLAVYFQGIDEVSHRFMHYVPPVRMELPVAEVERFGGTVAAFYEHQDQLLGELLLDATVATQPEPRLGRQARPVVMVISDHGFLSAEARPPRPADEFEAGAADWHRLHGIFILAGSGIRHADLGSVSIYDIYPTLLYLCGIPVPRDLPGRTLREAFEPSFLAERPLERVASLDVPFGPLEALPAVLPEQERQESLARLRALGYVGAGTQTRAAVAPSERAAGGPALSHPAPPRLENEFLTAHMNLGTILSERGDWEGASAEYRSVVERFPTYAPALYRWMQSEFERGRPDEAWTAAQRLLDLDPFPLEWLPAIAEVAAAAGHAGALRDVLANPDASRSAAPVWSARGIVALKAGRTQEAAAQLQRALEIDPLRTEALEALYSISRSAQARAQLIPVLEQALEIAPRSVFHLNYLAGLLVTSGRCAEARAHIAAALQENPDSAAAHANLAKCLVAEGKVEEATATLERGLERSPQDRGLLTTLGALEAGRGHQERAIALLERARALFPADPAILNALGLALLQSGRPDEARTVLQQSLAADPGQPEVRSLLAQIGG
ncbi:MAG: tetratricopeptide repeat protein [Acidobacteriota bacterium]